VREFFSEHLLAVPAASPRRLIARYDGFSYAGSAGGILPSSSGAFQPNCRSNTFVGACVPPKRTAASDVKATARLSADTTGDALLGA
jgi:hypothetical protein